MNRQNFCRNFSRKKVTSESFDNDNKVDTVSGFQNTPELKRPKTYTALSFDRINNMVNMFSLSRKPFVVCYCFREPLKTFFFDACQMTIKSRVLNLFPVPQTGRSHIINILLVSFFRSVLLITDPRFISMEKNSVRNLQYGPKTRLIRGNYLPHQQIYKEPNFPLEASLLNVHSIFGDHH